MTSSAEPTSRHIVFADTDSSAYHSLRQRPSTREERVGQESAPTSAATLARRMVAAAGPSNPVHLIERSHEGRVERLIPIRVGRMIASPYGFLRGSAVVMAHDVRPIAGHRNHTGRVR